jgi:hypothetical protein
VGFPALDSFALFLSASPSCDLLAIFVPCFCHTVNERSHDGHSCAPSSKHRDTSPSMSVPVSINLAVPGPFSYSWHSLVPTCALVGHHRFQNVSVTSYNCSWGQTYI